MIKLTLTSSCLKDDCVDIIGHTSFHIYSDLVF